MATMNISLPVGLKEYVESRVAGGDFSTVSDFMRDVLRREQQKHLAYIAYSKSSIKEGLESGICEESVDDVFVSVLTKPL